MGGGERSKRHSGGDGGSRERSASSSSSSISTPSRRNEDVRKSIVDELRNELSQVRDALSTEKRLVLRLVSDKERLTNKRRRNERWKNRRKL